MKKHSQKVGTNKKQFFNKLGMTYVELLCALSLLSLIVVMFTPMLLSSYDSLYKAGEKVESVYDSKTEIELGLADRFSETTITIEGVGFKNIKNNADTLFKSMNVKLKKVVSSLQTGLESAFGTSRATVDIISPRIVYDNQDNHNVVIQTTGLEYSQVMFGCYSDVMGNGNANSNQTDWDKAFIEKYESILNTTTEEDENGNVIQEKGTGLIFIEVILPDKTKSDDDAIYVKDNLAKVIINGTQLTAGSMLDLNNITSDGIIKFNVSAADGKNELDFTYSPVKITVYYVNNRGQVRTVSDYLTIEPATILLAGKSGTVNNKKIDYYTSAGVEDANGVYTLSAQGRTMRWDNSGLFTSNDTPSASDTIIQTVTWVENDENSHLRPYYVMAGKNSRVYRMYNFNSISATVSSVFSTAAGRVGNNNSNIASATNTKDVAGILADGTTTYPSFWSGEMSDQYSFKTMEHSSGYGVSDYLGFDCTSYYNEIHKIGGFIGIGGEDLNLYHVGSRYDYFDKTLRYSMQFHGFTSDYDYQHLANRRISYVLTEIDSGYSFRLGGKLRSTDEFNGYSLPWEPDNARYLNKGNRVKFGTFDYRIIAGSDKDTPYAGPVYFQGEASGGENKHYDRNFAYVRIKSMISINPIESTIAKDLNYQHRFMKGDFWVYKGNDSELTDGIIPNSEKENGLSNGWIAADTANCVNITSSIYLPGAGSKGQGQVIYFGTVPAFAFLRQSSDIGKNDHDARFVYNGENVKDSRATGYIIGGTQGEGSQVFRTFYAEPAGNNTSSVSDRMKMLCLKIGNHAGDIPSDYTVPDLKELNDRYSFYTDTSDDVIFYNDGDLEFTFGYCSRWRMSMGDVTSDGTDEETRSYEKYYRASTPTAGYYLTRVSKGDNRLNHQGRPLENGTVVAEDNLYYNTWFPGEYYNLVKVATCDEVTVAVGYAVSGSVFMKESAATTDGKLAGNGFFGTAMGSVYNDGILSAYVSAEAGGEVFKTGLSGKGEQNAIFQNLLYYKSPKFIDPILHSRKSIRFTAVDVFATITGSSEKKYVAVYGDSLGKAYYSVIATSKVEGNLVPVLDENGNPKTDDKGNVITEWKGTESEVKLRTENIQKGTKALTASDMIEIKVNNGQNSLSDYFSEITTIVADEDVVIISGKPIYNADGTAKTNEMIVVGEIKYNTNTKSYEADFEIVTNGPFTSYINDAILLNGYYYFLGSDKGNTLGEGWLAAIRVEDLKKISKSGKKVINSSEKLTQSNLDGDTNEPKLIYCYTPTELFALDGRVS